MKFERLKNFSRFTAMFAQTARHVLSTDFIENFVKKNQELNERHNNIDYLVGDAVNLKLQPERCVLTVVLSRYQLLVPLSRYLNEVLVVTVLQ